MTIDRRDFFSVIAAPLLRKLVPPVPMAIKPAVGYYLMDGVKTPYTIWRKKTATLLDYGSISFDIHFVPPDGRL